MVVIAGERSGVGKTTVTLALLSCLSQRGVRVQSFKVGPDYIDPMFHRHVTGRSCRNLDPVLTSEAYVQQCFARHTQDVTHAIVEGVMGLFDGAAHRHDFASTAHVARLLNLPVLLVLDCSRLSHSIAALVHGYRSFDPRLQLAGVVLNRVGSDRHLELLKSALKSISVPILGVLRRQDSIAIPDRHLGLVPTAELSNLNSLIATLAHLGETCFDWATLMPLLETGGWGVGIEAPSQNSTDFLREHFANKPHASRPRIAIAHDAAFSFYYADNLELLDALGAEPLLWSPLKDANLPQGTQGLYFGGGFPEMFAESLGANKPARQAIRTAIAAGIPTYAECGGLMYLARSLTTFDGHTFPMVGSLPTEAVMDSRLVLGYRQAIVQHDTPLLNKGRTVWGHEFHRSQLTTRSPNPLFEFSPSPHFSPRSEGWHTPNLHASYLHLHWGAHPEIPQRFLQHCSTFSR
ncbi:cobyrinate a,c-diamide synthase [Leptolyngbya sp. FACHB-36]|uniref:cobyrinate a,c-diamide synthase n=1 Tax=Leptolyngbya sp. FACHB-36 TaxID=2692808 RepID=UPI00167FF89A|nr:cobyrinate a,c-diamide synthase [Leptolyngbya sp. FACHB-36]MBD2020529.1 cobyrinate a,c-diamide synthase [Leptolyngbya sp. FACHB-36]